jgi:hypothetical protein
LGSQRHPIDFGFPVTVMTPAVHDVTGLFTNDCPLNPGF